MKTKSTTLLLILLLLASMHSNAQNIKDEGLEKRAQNIFIELGGQGLLFTANYDSRFSNKRDGLGGRIGIGYIAEGGDKATTVPIALNYLLGKGKHYFEMGLGTTFQSTRGDKESFYSDKNNSSFLGTMSFAYRLQPIDRGFSLRVGLSPVFNKNFFIPYYAGLSLGYSF